MEEQENRSLERISYQDLHQRLLEQFAPPSIVVNEEYDIIHLSDRAGRYLQIRGGEPSNNLLKVVRPELRLELRTALYQAVQKRINVEARNLTVKIDGRAETINIFVRPVLRHDDPARGFILVVFEKTDEAPDQSEAVLTLDEPVAQQLEEELMRQIKEQSRIFDTTLNSISDFAYILDHSGRFRYANQPLLSLLEITLEEIKGKNFFDLNYPVDLATRLQKQIQTVFDTGEIIRDETPFTSPAGESGFYEYIFTPVFSGGAVESVAGSTRDVTTRKRTEESLRFQARLLDTVEQSAIATDLDGTIIYWNRFAERIYGWTAEEAVGRSITELTTPTMIAEQAEEIMSQLRVGKSWTGEFIVKRRDGTTFPAQIIDSPIEDAQGNLVGIIGVSFDISERKQAEIALRQSEERARLMIEGATDFAIFKVSPENVIETWNAGAEQVFGWTESEIIGQSGAVLFTPEDREQDVPRKELETARNNGRAEDERWHIRRDGTRFYASGVMMSLDEGAEGFVKIARDQTKKIEAEKAQRDKEILQRLVGAQEEERKRIARDLHDQLGQQLTVLRLKLEATKKICGEEEVYSKIDEMQSIARQIDADVDFLAWELRPAALDDLGLVATLQNYVNEWSKHSGIASEFHTSGLKRKRLTPEIETNLYRIAQETLNNVYKHADAKSINVLVEKRDSTVVLIIEDDGKGFDPDDKINRNKGLGLIGMRERAMLIGGTLEIESALKQGTTIYVRVPAQLSKKE